jgi:replication-associated recombination protein RarA
MARPRKIPTGTSDPDRNKEPTTTALGYPLGVVASALQKEIRRGDVEAAVYWGLLLWKKAPPYAWKRVLVTAAEDIGLAAPEIVTQVGVLNGMYRAAKEGAWYVSPHHFTMAVVLLSRARKSTEIEDLQTWTLELIKAGVKREVPEYALDAHTQQGKAAGASWRDWYAGRLAMGMPVNEYTRRLWAMKPEWRPAELQDDQSPTEPGESTA